MDSILQRLTGIGGAVKAPARAGYFTSYTVEDGDAAYDTQAEIIALAPAVGVKMRIWERTTPAQQAVSWGYGSPAQPENEGFIFFCIALAATGFDVGTVLLGHENHSRHLFVPIDEFNDTLTHTADFTTMVTARTTDRRLLRPLPEGGYAGFNTPLVGQDSRLTIDYTAIVLVAEDVAAFTIPATVYD